MDTLPRFRLPDESSSRDVSKLAGSGAWGTGEFDDLDKMATRVLEKNSRIALRPFRATNENVDDVVEELRAAAAGRSSRVRELKSDDLLEEIPDPDAAQEVDVSELVFDRAVARRDVWNMRQARAPQVTHVMNGPTKIQPRFVATAAVAMLLGALLAIAAAFTVWHFSGLKL